MFSKQSSFTTFQTLFIVLISCSIFYCACDQKKPTIDNKQTSSESIIGQPSFQLLNSSQANSLLQHYAQDSGNINHSFLYTGIDSLLRKVNSFMMDNQQRLSFFEVLKELNDSTQQNTPIDSVRLFFRMALFNSHQSSAGDSTTNFTPMLQFVVNKDSMIYPTYPLLAFEPKTNWHSFKCENKPTGTPSTEDEINCTKAVSLINDWIDLPRDSIDSQLYLFDTTKTISNRVRYYVFEQSDTKEIYDHYKIITQNSDTCFFHLHLGKLDSAGFIPMRNVIHLDNKDLSSDSVFSASPSTFFEFAKPCPKFCAESS